MHRPRRAASRLLAGRPRRGRAAATAAPGPPPAPARAASEELRLVGAHRSRDGLDLFVQVRETPALVRLAEGHAELRLGAHLTGARGGRVWDGPRSDAIALAMLRWAPVVRRVRLADALTRTLAQPRAQLDLVVEGVAWGSSRDLATLDVPLAALPLAGPGDGPPRGPAPPAEAPSTTRAWLAAAWPEGALEPEMAAYVGQDLARFLLTVQLAGEQHPGRMLEIGANPYFATRLLGRRFPDAPLTLTNFFGAGFDRGDAEGRFTQAVVRAGGEAVGEYVSDLVDVEGTALPYADASFDTVLFCEVLEHFTSDPVFALGQLHRVLAPDGRLVLSTPNVARAENLRRVAQGQGLYDPYSRFGPHGRHNREYSGAELVELLAGNGFAVERYLTRPVHDVREPDAAWFAAADDDGAGDYHFVVARRREAGAPHRPPWLYR